MTNQELTLLVAKAKAGDKRALNDLLAAFYDDLSHFALRTVKDPELAADITQDSCIEIISSIGDLENPDRFGSWARTIVYHKCMRYFNSKKEIIADENEDGDTIFDQLPDEEGSLPERVLEDKEFQRIMQQLLDELPGEQRAALMLYYYERMSVKQIASIQGVGEGTVKSRLNYGRKAVKAQVEAYEKKSGTKLHAALPLVLLGLFDYGKKSTPVANLPLSVTAAIESFGKTSAVSSSAVLKAGAPSKSGVAVAGHVATKGAALAVKKIVIGVIAALVAAGGALGGVLLATNGLSSGPAVSNEQERPSSAVVDDPPSESDGGGEVPPSEHAHSGRAWEFVDDTHYSICTICGQQVGKAEAHLFDDEGNCTVCDCGYFSKGLVYEHLGKYILQVAGIGSCTDETIVIPAIYKGCSVVSIDMGAFQDNTQIKKVVIPDEFDTVCEHAFSGCTSLTEVQFLGSCRLLQSYSFENCTALKKVTLPVIPQILGGIFNNSSSLEELTIPEGVQTIGQGAFYDCTALKKVSFPSTLRHIEDMAFDGCSSLEALSLPEGTEHIGEQAFFGCSALTELSVPGSVRTVARSAFSLCTNLREVVLLDGVSEVVSAFENCDALERVTIPTSLSSVVGVFSGSDKLKTVIYSGTAAEWHAVDKGPWSVSAEGFTVRCSDRTYTGDSPFVHDFPESFTVTAVGHSKRCACGEQSSVEAHNLENGYCIDCGWGASCGHLEFMEMPDGYYVSWFGACTDRHVVIPESYNGKPVTGIAPGAFVYCTTVETITLPKSVRFIGRQAFEGCENLVSINLWDVEYMEGFAFNRCTALKTVELSSCFVEDSVFSDCTGLVEAKLLGECTLYGADFQGCTSLERVTLTRGIESIDILMFAECSALKEFRFWGSCAEWNALPKDDISGEEQDLSWNRDTGSYQIICLDGTLAKE